MADHLGLSGVWPEDVVERVARAIAIKIDGDDPRDFTQVSESSRERLLEEARYVLGAIDPEWRP